VADIIYSLTFPNGCIVAILHTHRLPQLRIREVEVPKCSDPSVVFQKEISPLDIAINGYRALFRKKMCLCNTWFKNRNIELLY